MGFIERMNKRGVKISINKTSIYKKIESERNCFEKLGLNLKIKNEFDLFEYEIIYRGILTQNYIENAYEIFMLNNQEILHYVVYGEKQKMFNRDIEKYLLDAPHFLDESSQSNICIPYIEPRLNVQYTSDFQVLTLKQHRNYLNNLKIKKNTPSLLYGDRVFFTRFSSLENVYEDERHICLYFDELKTIYIFKKENKELINKFIVTDQESIDHASLEIIKEVAHSLEQYDYKKCLDILYAHQYISEKTYKKLSKDI